MAITYSPGAGTTITTHAMNETVVAQTDQVGNNTVVVSDTIVNAGNGQIGSGANGIGDSYVNRLIIIDLGLSTEQRRFCTAEVAATGTTWLLTVHEDWDTNPVVTTDTIHVAYEPADIEDGGVSSGIGLGSKTGLWELTNFLVIANTGGLQLMLGQALEADDSGADISCTVQSGGYLYSGYEAGGGAVNGGIFTNFKNSTTEPSWQFQSGGHARLYDSLLWGQLVAQQFECASGSDFQITKTKLISLSNELLFFGTTVTDGSASGRGGTTELVRIDAAHSSVGFVLSNTAGVTTTVADTAAETLTIRDWLFSGNISDIIINSNKTWDVINPIWNNTVGIGSPAIEYPGLDFLTATGNRVNEKYSLDIVAADPAGNVITDAGVFVYEGLVSDDLVVVTLTDVDGVVADSWLFIEYLSTSATLYGNHAIRVYKYGKTPFVAAKASDSKFSGTVTLTEDSAITEASQSTALTNGAGILPVHHAIGEADPRPMKVLNYDGGTGSVPTVGETITQGSATGVVVEYLGDGVSGTLVLETWNGTEFTDNQTMSGGASTFNGITDLIGGTSFYQEYSWEVDCSSKSLIITYDYLAAEMAGLGSPILDAIYEQLHEWGGSDEAQAIYSGTAGYFTERALQEFGSPDTQEGVWLSNRGSGTIAYMTSDAGVQYTPPASFTFKITGIQTDSEARIFETSTRDEIGIGIEDTTGGVTKATIVDGGTGYTVADVLTVQGGTGTAATLTVTSVLGGVITGVSISNPGVYSANPTNDVNVTGGTGTGAQFRLSISGEFSYTYVYSTDIDFYAVVFHLDYKDLRLTDQVLSNADQTIPIQQITDRVYSNP